MTLQAVIDAASAQLCMKKGEKEGERNEQTNEERERERGEQGFVRLDHDSRRGVITIIKAQFNALNKEIDATPTARSLFESVSVCT